jgi:hypothetical protein
MKKKKKPHKPTRPQATAGDKAEAILNWIDCRWGKKVSGSMAEFMALEKQEWWQKFRDAERRATKAIFDKLAAQGVPIYNKRSIGFAGNKGIQRKKPATRESMETTRHHRRPAWRSNEPAKTTTQ